MKDEESGGRCPNMNHGRTNAPVGFCPNCGKSVNSKIRQGCDNAKHSALRKQGDKFCVHCAKKL